MQDRLTDAMAASAITSPIWLKWMEDASNFAAIWLPILGAIWLIVQIVAKIITIRKLDKKE